MHQDSPLARTLGSLTNLPIIGRLFDQGGSALKGFATFVFALLLLPFTGIAPLLFWLLYMAATKASHVAVATATSTEKRRMPFGLTLIVLIAFGLGIYSLWPAGASAPAAASAAGQGLGWMRGNVAGFQMGGGSMLSSGSVEGMPSLIMYAQIISAKVFGSALTGANMMIAMMFVAGVGGFVLFLMVKPYLLGSPQNFARDAEGIYRLSRADKLGGISRKALAVIDTVLKKYDGNTRGECLANAVDGKFANHPNPLLRGDIEASARADYPPSKYRMLHTRMPLDMVRSVVVMGWTITGEPLISRAPLLISRSHVVKGYDSAIRAALPAEGAVSVAGYYLAAAVFFAVANLTSSLLGAGWIITVLCTGLAAVSAFAAWKLHEVSAVQRVAAAALRPCNISPILNRVINSRPDLLEMPKNAVGPYQESLDLIYDANEQWNKQIEIGMKDPFKLIQLGVARGRAQFRNDISAYKQGQAVVASADDLARGGLFYDGPTGSGKSYAFLNPFMAQCMDPELMFMSDEVENEMSAKENSQAVTFVAA